MNSTAFINALDALINARMNHTLAPLLHAQAAVHNPGEALPDLQQAQAQYAREARDARAALRACLTEEASAPDPEPRKISNPDQAAYLNGQKATLERATTLAQDILTNKNPVTPEGYEALAALLRNHHTEEEHLRVALVTLIDQLRNEAREYARQEAAFSAQAGYGQAAEVRVANQTLTQTVALLEVAINSPNSNTLPLTIWQHEDGGQYIRLGEIQVKDSAEGWGSFTVYSSLGYGKVYARPEANFRARFTPLPPESDDDTRSEA